jgi:hypothetical protein
LIVESMACGHSGGGKLLLPRLQLAVALLPPPGFLAHPLRGRGQPIQEKGKAKIGCQFPAKGSILIGLWAPHSMVHMGHPQFQAQLLASAQQKPQESRGIRPARRGYQKARTQKIWEMLAKGRSKL